VPFSSRRHGPGRDLPAGAAGEHLPVVLSRFGVEEPVHLRVHGEQHLAILGLAADLRRQNQRVSSRPGLTGAAAKRLAAFAPRYGAVSASLPIQGAASIGGT
jgi:hypothetical protein